MYGLGIHLGPSYTKQNALFNRFVLVQRKGYQILDLNKSILLIKRSFFFFSNIIKNKGIVYYSYNDLNLINNINFYYLRNRLKNYLNNISFNSFKMIGGSFTNYKTCFLEFIYILIRRSFRGWHEKTKFGRGYKISFLKLFLFFLKKSYNKKLLNIHNLNVYWRCIIFLKNISTFFKIPDLIIYLGGDFMTKEVSSSLIEFKKLSLPTIGLCDNGYLIDYFSYFIPSNSRSFIVSFFFLSIFSNVLLKTTNLFFRSMKKIKTMKTIKRIKNKEQPFFIKKKNNKKKKILLTNIITKYFKKLKTIMNSKRRYYINKDNLKQRRMKNKVIRLLDSNNKKYNKKESNNKKWLSKELNNKKWIPKGK